MGLRNAEGPDDGFCVGEGGEEGGRVDEEVFVGDDVDGEIGVGFLGGEQRDGRVAGEDGQFGDLACGAVGQDVVEDGGADDAGCASED